MAEPIDFDAEFGGTFAMDKEGAGLGAETPIDEIVSDADVELQVEGES